MLDRSTGRPDKVKLIFDRRIIRTTPGQFRTRVFTRGVIPTFHVDYKRSKIKQYHKEEPALRTETSINDNYDFQVGRLLKNLGKLRRIGFTSNRHLLNFQTLSHDCLIGSAGAPEDQFQQHSQTIQVNEQRASALRFGDKRVLALMHALCQFCLLPEGLRHRNLRPVMTELLELELDEYSQGKMTYDLRQLRMHGVIERVPGSQRYRLTKLGIMASQFYTRIYARVHYTRHTRVQTMRSYRHNLKTRSLSLIASLANFFRRRSLQLDPKLDSNAR